MLVQTAMQIPSQEEWYAALLAAVRTKERPAHKARGRCLADVLENERGLTTAERNLLWSVYAGERCKASGHVWREEQDLKQLQSDRNACVRASFLRFLALGGDELVPVHEAGIELSHAYVDGTIDLHGGTCVKRLCLDTCYVNGALQIADASLGILVLQNSRVSGISGNRAKITGTAFLENVVSDGSVSFHRAEIGGSLQCGGASIGSGGQWALDCSLARISGGVLLNNGFNAGSRVSFNGAHVGGNLNCSGATLANPGDTALDAEGLHVGGSIMLTTELIKEERRRFTAKGEVRLIRAHIGGNLDCDEGRFDNADRTALRAEDLHADGSILLRDGFSANGEVWLRGADIGRDLDCSGGTFTNAKGRAIILDRACISGVVWLRPAGGEPRTPFKSVGSVSLISAEIGALYCNGGLFTAAEGPQDRDARRAGTALDCSRASIRGGAYLGQIADGNFCRRFEADGFVSFSGANIAGHLWCSGGSFKGLQWALDCSGTTIKQGASLSQVADDRFPDRFEADGLVSFAGANIEGGLWCSGGSFKAREIADKKDARSGMALDCSTARMGEIQLRYVEIKGSQHGRQFEAQGEVSFQAAQIGGHLDCAGGRFVNPSGVALRCQAATVTGCVFLRQNYTDHGVKEGPPFESIGEVRFTGTSVGLQFDCQGGQFENSQPDPTHEGLAGAALDLSVATIKDTLFLGVEGESKVEKRQAAAVNGSLKLTGTRARQLVDNGFIGRSTLLQRWFSEFARRLGFGRPDGKGLARHVQRVDGKMVRAYLELDGFVYERIAGSSSGKAALRMTWLQHQPPRHLAKDFRTQPFEQLVKVLRAMGHGRDADRIAIAKRRCLRRARPLWRRILFSPWEVVLLDGFMGYGYHLSRALLILTAIGIAYGYFYDYQARQGGIVPAKSEIAKGEAFKTCRPPLGNWVDCEGLDKAYRPFNPWLYSANVMLPIVEFGQKSSWEPASDHPLVYYLQCAEIGIGWLCGILLGAVLGLVKRE